MSEAEGRRASLVDVKPAKIGVFRALQLGDLLCAVPALRAIRAAFSDADVALIGLPWAEEFVRRFGTYVDRLIEFPGHPGLAEQSADISRAPEFIRSLQQEKFDLLIQLHGDGSIVNSMLALAGAQIFAGFFSRHGYRPNEQYFIKYPEQGNEIQRLLALTQALGLESAGGELEFPITARERSDFEAIAGRFGLLNTPYICLHPGSRSAARRWKADSFARVATRLAQTGRRIILTGSSEEREITLAVKSRTKGEVLDLTGITSLGELACLIQNSSLVLTNDTAVSHIAAAVGARSVVIFTGSELSRWAPLDTSLHRSVRPGFAFGEESVVREALQLLSGATARAA